MTFFTVYADTVISQHTVTHRNTHCNTHCNSHCGVTLHPQLAFYAYGNAACPVGHGRYATCFKLTEELDKLKGEEARLGKRPAAKTAAGARNPLKVAAKLHRASVEAKAKTHGAEAGGGTGGARDA